MYRSGAGGHAWDDFYSDFYDKSTARQTFAHWDLKMITWLEKAGYKVEYCTDLDLHQDGSLLDSYRLLLSVGHDEYWSEELRTAVENFIARGGNVAFFSGNTCWWRVHIQNADGLMHCDKGESSPTFEQWYLTRPENAVTGVSYRNAGGVWNGPRQMLGYTVQYSNQWVFSGGLSDGAVFGGPQALVGYECDGAALSPEPGPLGYAMPSYADGTPDTFLILGLARLAPGWEDRKSDLSAATMGIYSNGGTVFTAGTTDWARVLAAGEPSVDRITRNVLERLTSRSVRIRGISSKACGPLAVEGQTRTFTVDTGALPNPGSLLFTWTASNSTVTGTNPTFDVTFPTPPAPVTITVTVDDGTQCKAFGAITFTPVTQDSAKRIELLCLLRTFVVGATVHHLTERGVRDLFTALVDPLWDPIRGEPIHRIFEQPHEIQAGLRALNLIQHLLEQLSRSSESRKGSSEES